MDGKRAAAAILALSVLGLLGVALFRSIAIPATDPTVGAPAPVGHAAMTARGPVDGAMAAPEAPTTTGREVLAPAQPGVFGMVVDPGGAPIADAVLSLFDFASGQSTTARSGGDGAYEFADARGSVGLFQLAIEKAGYGRGVAAEVCASLQPRRDVLAAGLVIRGRVIEAGEHRPVPAFRVLAVRLPFQDEGEWDELLALHRQAIPEGLRADRTLDVTEPAGTFCLRDLAAGKYALLVAPPGRQPVFCNGGGKPWDLWRGVEARPEPEAAVVEIALPASGVAVVEVVDRASGLPVNDARVATRICVARGKFRFANAHPARSAPNRFELPVGLDRDRLGDIACEVTAPGYAPNRLSAGGQDDGHVFVVELGRPATVRGLVHDAQGSPLAGAVILIERDSDGSLVGSARAAADGRYEIGGLDAPSAQMLRCLLPSLDSVLATVPLRLADGETCVVDVGGAAAGILRGTVAVLGRPQPEALVMLDGAAGKVQVHCTTRADGVFAFAGLLPGNYELVVVTSSAGRSLRADRIVEVGAGSTQKDFDFGLRVSGIVKDVSRTAAAPGKLQAEAEVVAQRQGAPGASDRIDVGADGRFDLLIAEPGVYQLSVDGGENWQTVMPRSIDLRTATRLDGVELQVVRDLHEGRIELHIVDAASGQPAEGAVIWSHRNARGEAEIEAGLYVEEHAGLGRYRFTIKTAQHRPVTVELEVTAWQPQVERRIALVPAQAVRITEVEPAGAAHRAGIQAGDLVQRYGAVEVHSAAALRAAIAAGRSVVTIVIERDGVERSLTAEAGELGVELENVR